MGGASFWGLLADRGAQGIEGVGTDGQDALGVESIFARTSGDVASIPQNQRPSNSWGFDEPETRNGLAWTDGAESVTPSLPTLWRSDRDIFGVPVLGVDISDTWSVPIVVGRLGADGSDAAGVEHIFSRTSEDVTSIPASQLPDDSWGFDAPEGRGGLTWTDGAPTLTSDLQTLWRSDRDIFGAPVLGADISDAWSTPVVAGRYGDDGFSIARVPIFKRLAQAPTDLPGGPSTYTFETATLDIVTPNGWSADFPPKPIGIQPPGRRVVWARFAAARSNTATDTIDPSEWSYPFEYTEEGRDGADGAVWHDGHGDPPGSLGKSGDFFFDLSAATVWKKSIGTWEKQISLGSTPGSTWFADSGPPIPSLGEKGDFYFRTDNGLVYEKTATATWTFKADITGTDGTSSTIITTLEQPNGNIFILFSDGSSITVPAGTIGDGITDIERDSTTGNMTVTLSNGQVVEYFLADGIDGEVREYVYMRMTEEVKPDVPPNDPDVDDYVPDGFTDDPSGVDATNKFEWEFLRKGMPGEWGGWNGGALHSRYVSDIEIEAVRWKPGIDYKSGVVVYVFVIVNGISVQSFYKCFLAHTSSQDNKPPNTSYWTVGPAPEGSEFPPSVPRNFTLEAESQRVRLSWVAPESGSAPFTYTVQRSLTSGFGSFDAIASKHSGLYIVDTFLSPSTRYYYRVRAENGDPATQMFNAGPAVRLEFANPDSRISYRFQNVVGGQFVGTLLNDLFSAVPGVELNTISIVDSGDILMTTANGEFSTPFETNGFLYLSVEGNAALYLDIRAPDFAGNILADGTHPYEYTPANASEVVAFWNAYDNAYRNVLPRPTLNVRLDFGASAISTQQSAWVNANVTTSAFSAVPGTPVLSASVVSASQIDLSWTQPSGTLPFTYRAERAKDSAFTINKVVLVGNQEVLSFSNRNLLDNDLYYFRVRAVGDGGTGPWGTTSARTSAAIDGPNMPQNLSASVQSTTQVNLSWDPSYSGTGPFTYRIERADNDAFTGATVLAGAQSSTSFNSTGLSGDRTYYFRVRAMGPGGTGPWATVSAITIASTTGIIPAIVRNFAANIASATQVDLRWDAPSAGTTPFTYDVERMNSTYTTVLFNYPDVLGTSLGVGNLAANTTFYWRIRATNSAGNGPRSTVSGTTDADATAPSDVQNLALTHDSTGPLNLIEWDAPSAGTTPFTYRVDKSLSTAFTSFETVSAAQSGTDYTDTSEFTPGFTYHYRVRAMGPGGTGPFDAVQYHEPLTEFAPTVPQNFSAIALSNIRIMLSWTPSDSGTEPIRYQLQRKSGDNNFNSPTNLLVFATRADTPITDTNSLQGSTTYWYRLRATGPGGFSNYTNILEVTTL